MESPNFGLDEITIHLTSIIFSGSEMIDLAGLDRSEPGRFVSLICDLEADRVTEVI